MLKYASDPGTHIVHAIASDGRDVHCAFAGDDLTDVTDPAGGVRHYTLDLAGRMLSESDPDGRVLMTNTFDSAGRVLSQSTVDAEVTFAYDDLKGTTTVTDTRTGESTVVQHDTSGHPVSMTDSTGHKASRTYDSGVALGPRVVGCGVESRPTTCGNAEASSERASDLHQ